MISLDMPIVVEGKYDKIKLSSLFDTPIITTDGFGIFKDKEKCALLRRLAGEKGVIVLTDSDNAGGIIRSYLKNILKEEQIYHVFLPRLKGKERRKEKPSAEGLLGVEGIDHQTILKAFERFIPSESNQKRQEITTAFLMELGLCGGSDSQMRRRYLLDRLDLPYAMSTSTLKKILAQISNPSQIREIMHSYRRNEE